jgi:hypothetical protein
VATFAATRRLDRTTYDSSGNESWHVERVFFSGDGQVTDTQYDDESGNVLLV